MTRKSLAYWKRRAFKAETQVIDLGEILVAIAEVLLELRFIGAEVLQRSSASHVSGRTPIDTPGVIRALTAIRASDVILEYQEELPPEVPLERLTVLRARFATLLAAQGTAGEKFH